MSVYQLSLSIAAFFSFVATLGSFLIRRSIRTSFSTVLLSAGGRESLFKQNTLIKCVVKKSKSTQSGLFHFFGRSTVWVSSRRLQIVPRFFKQKFERIFFDVKMQLWPKDLVKNAPPTKDIKTKKPPMH